MFRVRDTEKRTGQASVPSTCLAIRRGTDTLPKWVQGLKVSDLEIGEISMKEVKRRFEDLLNEIFSTPDDVFREFLDMALKLWDYRVRERGGRKGNPYGIEYVFQTYVVEKIWRSLIDEKYDFYFSESILEVVRRGGYKEETFTHTKGCIQPDLVIVKDKKISVIMEIKCIENGCWNWVFSSDGTAGNMKRGDIVKLQKIKREHPEISCYELVINRGKWDSSCWGNDLYEKFKSKNYIEEKRTWEIFENLSGKLVEILM